MELQRWMFNPKSDEYRDSVLDRAVLGELTNNEVCEILEDFDLTPHRLARGRFATMLNLALTKHGL
jgi:hypothetical protein